METKSGAVTEDNSKSITQHQEVLENARAKPNYVVGGVLITIPNDMNLQMGTITEYNDKIVTATDTMNIGTNEDVSTTPPDGTMDPLDNTTTIKRRARAAPKKTLMRA